MPAKSARRLAIAGDRAAGGNGYIGIDRDRGAIAGLGDFGLFSRCRRRRTRSWNRDGLPGLQFAAVFDVIGLLQFIDRHFVHFGYGRQCLPARDGVSVSAGRV